MGKGIGNKPGKGRRDVEVASMKAMGNDESFSTEEVELLRQTIRTLEAANSELGKMLQSALAELSRSEDAPVLLPGNINPYTVNEAEVEDPVLLRALIRWLRSEKERHRKRVVELLLERDQIKWKVETARRERLRVELENIVGTDDIGEAVRRITMWKDAWEMNAKRTTQKTTEN